jgi:hypothetical protein
MSSKASAIVLAASGLAKLRAAADILWRCSSFASKRSISDINNHAVKLFCSITIAAPERAYAKAFLD